MDWFRRAVVKASLLAGLALPKSLRCNAEVSEVVDPNPDRLEREGSKMFGFQLLHEGLRSDARRDVRDVVRPAGLRNERLDPTDRLGVGIGTNESRCGVSLELGLSHQPPRGGHNISEFTSTDAGAAGCKSLASKPLLSR